MTVDFDIGFKYLNFLSLKSRIEPKDMNRQFGLLTNNFEVGSKSIDVVYEIVVKEYLDLNYTISETKGRDAFVYSIYL